MLLLILPALATLPSPELLRADPHRNAWRDATHAVRARAAEVPPPAADVDMGWDIRDYTLRVRVDESRRAVRGHLSIVADRTTGDDFVLHANGPTLTGIEVNGVSRPWTVDGDRVLLGPIDGPAVDVDVYWTVTGASDTGMGLQWGDPTFAFHEPDGARTWLPVYDVPSDKATLRWEITVPDDDVVFANGTGTAVLDAEPGWKTWIFTFDGQIPTYLMTFHTGTYEVIEVADAPWGIRVAAYPDRVDAAEDTFANTQEMIEHFSDLYNPYPWDDYNLAMAPFGGAMEHTTVVTFGAELVGSYYGEIVNVHELGHHWWGDDVTLEDWPHIWLNEGFASYTEVLWYERAYGAEGRREYVASQADSYFQWKDYEGEGPLVDPNYLWGGTVYDKGSWVVHMLRGVLGDEVFFDTLRAYEAAYRYGVADSADFQSIVEAQTGEDMSWFFDAWLYVSGEPFYEWGWAAGPATGGWQVDVTIEQDRQEFTMPVPVRVTFADGTVVDERVVVSGAGVTASFCYATEPTAVELDPDLWVLDNGRRERSVDPVSTDNCVPDPEPDTADTAAPDTAAALPSDDEVVLTGDCGCSAGLPAPAWLGLAALAFLRRRASPAHGV